MDIQRLRRCGMRPLAESQFSLAPSSKHLNTFFRSRLASESFKRRSISAHRPISQDPTLANRSSEYLTSSLVSGTPLKNAAAQGHIEIVKLLVDRGADPNLPEEGIAPHGQALYSAVDSGHDEIANLLLAPGAFPNPEVETSADALSRAVSNSYQQMIELLRSYGAAQAMHLLAYC